jgi:hypothetical protein
MSLKEGISVNHKKASTCLEKARALLDFLQPRPVVGSDTAKAAPSPAGLVDELHQIRRWQDSTLDELLSTLDTLTAVIHAELAGG